MNSIRIHLGPMPEMLRTIVGDLLGRESDLQVVGNSADGEDAIRQARAERADVLITHDRDSEGTCCLGQVLAAPPISILSISDDGHSAGAVSLVWRPIALDASRESRLADAVRDIAGHRIETDSLRPRPA